MRKFAPGAHRFPKSALDGIILGARISPEDEAEIRRLALDSEVEWLRAEVDEDRFAMNIVPASA